MRSGGADSLLGVREGPEIAMSQDDPTEPRTAWQGSHAFKRQGQRVQTVSDGRFYESIPEYIKVNFRMRLIGKANHLMDDRMECLSGIDCHSRFSKYGLHDHGLWTHLATRALMGWNHRGSGGREMIDVPTELLLLAEVARDLPGHRAALLALRLQRLAEHVKAAAIVADAAEYPTGIAFVKLNGEDQCLTAGTHS